MPTSRHHLNLLFPGQADKHVTVNDALVSFDDLLHISVESTALTSPPADPVVGRQWIVAPSATGTWAGKSGQLAVAGESGWRYRVPWAGWTAWDRAEGRTVVFDGEAWRPLAVEPAQLARLGINTSPDATNRLSVAAGSTLLTHDGHGHQLVINKATASDTASVVFQSAYSGKAEIGLTGNDGLSIKLNAGGAGWTSVLTASPENGLVLGAPLRLLDCTVQTLPAAAPAGSLVRVTDDARGPTVAYRAEAGWRKLDDDSPLSSSHFGRWSGAYPFNPAELTSGEWYHSAAGMGVLVEAAPVPHRLYLTPFILGVRGVFGMVGVFTAAGAGGDGQVLRVGVYRVSGSRGLNVPLEKVADLGDLALRTASSVTSWHALQVPLILPPGLYFLAACYHQGTSPGAAPVLQCVQADGGTSQLANSLFGHPSAAPSVGAKQSVMLASDLSIADWSAFELPQTVPTSATVHGTGPGAQAPVIALQAQ